MLYPWAIQPLVLVIQAVLGMDSLSERHGVGLKLDQSVVGIPTRSAPLLPQNIYLAGRIDCRSKILCSSPTTRSLAWIRLRSLYYYGSSLGSRSENLGVSAALGRTCSLL